MTGDSTSTATGPFPFFKLPIDVRVIIYSYVLSWPTFTKVPHSPICAVRKKVLLARDRIPKCRETPMWPPERMSPAILRVSKKVKSEAMEELLRSPLVINEAPPVFVQGVSLGAPTSIHTSYISAPLLCNARNIVFNINADLSITEDEQKDTKQIWIPWFVFINHLWALWNVHPPRVERLTVRVGGRPGHGYDVGFTGRISEDNQWKLNPKICSCNYRDTLLPALVGMMKMLDADCSVQTQAPDTDVVAFLKKKTIFHEERPRPRFKFASAETNSIANDLRGSREHARSPQNQAAQLDEEWELV